MTDERLIVGYITDVAIDPSELTAAIRRPDCGAVVVFEGDVRSPNAEIEVAYLDYEAYTRVAPEQLEQIAREVAEEHDLAAVSVVHRTGRVYPGETAFFVGVAAAHRDPAFAGASLIVDRVKAEAAIWKTEIPASGS